LINTNPTINLGENSGAAEEWAVFVPLVVPFFYLTSVSTKLWLYVLCTSNISLLDCEFQNGLTNKIFVWLKYWFSFYLLVWHGIFYVQRGLCSFTFNLKKMWILSTSAKPKFSYVLLDMISSFHSDLFIWSLSFVLLKDSTGNIPVYILLLICFARMDFSEKSHMEGEVWVWDAMSEKFI